VVVFSLVCTLVEQTGKVVRHCMEQECGVGEVPSLPRVLHKIFITTLSYLGRRDHRHHGPAQGSGGRLLLQGEGLAHHTPHTDGEDQEDGLDILVGLCFELVNFHEVLIPLDFKLTCMVWRVYVKLTSTH
jgi:hypothetical protein